MEHLIPDDGVAQWPKELQEWRVYPPEATMRNMLNVYLWREMIPAFSQQGVVPYTPELDVPVAFWRVPPNPDQAVLPVGAYETKPGTHQRAMQQTSPSIYPATLADGSDVFLKVVSKGPEPSQQLRILRYLSAEPLRSIPENHAIPVPKELTYNDWTFVAMPRYGPTNINVPSFFPGEWFTTVREMLDFVGQSLEAFAFLHDHLIAHQDIWHENFVLNHLGHYDAGYLSRFPARYYIIDFEHAVQFSADSAPDARRVVGPPVEGFAPHRLAPEIGQTPHCPFAADVWQLGLMLFKHFPTQVPGLRPIIAGMLAPRPEDRPTMHDALEQFREMRRNAVDSEDAAVQRNYLFDNMKHEQFAGVMQAFLRGEDVEFVNRDLDADKVVLSGSVL